MVDAIEKFKGFLKTLKDESNTAFMESIEEGFSVCFEDESMSNDPNNPNEPKDSNLQSSEEIQQAIDKTKKQEEVLTKLNDEQKDVENVRSELDELNKEDTNNQSSSNM